jgi:hypothetical protein
VFKYSSRFWLYAPITVFFMIAAAVAVHWWMAAGAFEKKLAGLKGRQVIPGIILDWKGVQIGGFPFRLDADFTNFTIQGAGAHGPFTWTSDKFALHALTYGRSQDVYEAAGQQRLNWTGADSSTHAASFLPGSMRGSSVLDAQGLRRFDLDIVDLNSPALLIARLQFHLRRNPNGNDLDLMARIENLYFRRTVDSGISLTQTYASLTRISSLHALLRGEESWPQATANWRKSGGVLKQGPTQARVFPHGVRDPQNIAATVFGPLY